MRKLLLISVAILIGILAILIAPHFHADIPLEKLKATYAPEPSQFVEIEGLQVHYRDEGSGFPLVLIHGTSSSLHTWQGWTEALKDTFRVIRLDMPGFGLTGPNADHNYQLDYYADFLQKFLEKRRVDSCHLAGNSLGGAIVWAFAAKYPDRTGKIILIDAAGYSSADTDRSATAIKLAQNPVLKPVVRYLTPKPLIRKSLLEVYGDDSKVTNELVNLYFDMVLRAGNREAFIASVNRKGYKTLFRISDVKAPALVMWGELDEWIPVSHADSFLRDLSRAKVLIYPGVGHVPMEEIPEETAGDALDFLKASI